MFTLPTCTTARISQNSLLRSKKDDSEGLKKCSRFTNYLDQTLWWILMISMPFSVWSISYSPISWFPLVKCKKKSLLKVNFFYIYRNSGLSKLNPLLENPVCVCVIWEFLILSIPIIPIHCCSGFLFIDFFRTGIQKSPIFWIRIHHWGDLYYPVFSSFRTSIYVLFRVFYTNHVLPIHNTMHIEICLFLLYASRFSQGIDSSLSLDNHFLIEPNNLSLTNKIYLL